MCSYKNIIQICFMDIQYDYKMWAVLESLIDARPKKDDTSLCTYSSSKEILSECRWCSIGALDSRITA